MPHRGELTEQAYQTVKHRLMTGVYQAGDRISVEGMVDELGTSRQPILDALKRLETERYLEIIPQVGVQVVVPERRDVLDFFRVLAATESVCAALAAERGDPPGRAQLAAINAQIGGLLDEPTDDDECARRFRVLNRSFHQQINALSQSHLLAPLIANMWDHSDFFVQSLVGTDALMDRLPDICVELDRVYRAVATNDPDAAFAAMESHVLAYTRAVERS